VDLAELVENILEMHRVAIGRHGVELEIDLQELPAVYIEKNKLVQVLDNLIKHAIESMAEHRGRRCLTIRGERLNDDNVRITVSDTGLGIHPEHMASIFTYGFTTKAKGNGFGLHSTALAMQALGGAIRVQSDGPGRGASFEVDVPFRQSDDRTPSGAGGERIDLVTVDAHSSAI